MTTSTDAIEAALKAAEVGTAKAAKAPAPKPEKPAAKAKPSAKPTSWKSQIGTVLFSIATIAVIVLGYLNRDTSYLTAEEGLGYALGIFGAVTMLLLLGYPARKRLAFMRRWGKVKTWFSTHMVMGVIAPVAILFHANFQLGSLNSNIALWITLTVAGSGVIGRFIYTKVHYGLYGGRATLNSLRDDALSAKGELSAQFAFAPQLRAQLQVFEDLMLSPSRGPLHSIWRVMSLGIRVRLARRRMNRFLSAALALKSRQAGWPRKETRRQRRDAERYLNGYLRTVRKVVELGVYERLFSFWHLLHLPLFFMLTIAAIVHVVAVHMY